MQIQVCAVRDLFGFFLCELRRRLCLETRASESRLLKSRHPVVYVELCFVRGGQLLPAATDRTSWSTYQVTLSIQKLHSMIVNVSCILGPLTLTPVSKAACFQQQQMH